jgi:hypothetical protein
MLPLMGGIMGTVKTALKKDHPQMDPRCPDSGLD